MAEDERLHTNHRITSASKVGCWRRGPRNVKLVRHENNDFGFTLRHFIIYPPESYQVLARNRRLGLRLCEGQEDGSLDTIFVKSVRPGSPADIAGLFTGDRILGVNGEPIVHRPYPEVVQLIQTSTSHLSLLVVSKEEDIIQQCFGDTAHNPETNTRPERIRSPEMHRSSATKHPALTVPRRSLDAMPQHHTAPQHHHLMLQHHTVPQLHSRPPLTPAQALDYDRPMLNPSPGFDRPMLDRFPTVPLPGTMHDPVIPTGSLDYDPRLLDPGSSPLTTPGSRLSLDGGSPSRDSRESSVNSVHSSDDSVIISRIFKSCEKKEEFLRRPVVWTQPAPDGRQVQYWHRAEAPPPVWPSAIPASSVPPAAPPSPGPFICGGAVSNPPVTLRYEQHAPLPSCVRFVSERARQFESGQCQPDKTVLYKSELARLGQTNSGSSVAVRRREFESKADWRTHRESRSLDSTTSTNSSLSQVSSMCTSTPVNTPAGTPVQQLSGNRTIPVGGTKLHCEPLPEYRVVSHGEKEVRPRSNSLGAALPLQKSTERRRNKAVRQDSYLAAVKKITDEERSTRRESYIKATTGPDGTLDTMDHETEPDSETSIRSVTNQLPPCDKEVTIDGNLAWKVSLIVGKKSADRSWKSVWAVVINHTLFLFRDKKDFTSESPVDYERIDLECVSVSIAEDYSKRRHVLRLSTSCSSEILLQTESSTDMSRWLQALHHDNNNTPQSLSGVELLSGGGSKGSSSRLAPFRNRSPTDHSPTTKTRKPSQSDNVVVPVPKTKTWKVKLSRSLNLKKSVSPAQYPEYPEGATIGVPLDLCPQSNTLEFVPLLVELCTHIVEDKGLDIIGIYRVPGNTAAVSSLTEAVNRGLDSAVLDQDQRWSDVNVISSLLKSFFRKLPDCLLTTELYPRFIDADKIDDPRKRVAVLRKLVHELPPHNLNTLRHLLFHLKTVVNHSGINKMEARNLAIVFGPTLIKAGDNNMATLVNDMSHQCRIVETLILYVDWCFSDDEMEKLVLREDACSAELHESETTNQSLLLNNIHKVEGLKESPTKDVSAKDIVSSIISAANRKMQKARRGKSIAFIAEENLPCADLPESTKHRDEKGERPDSIVGQVLARSKDLSLPTVASHVRQSVLFSGSVTSKLLAANQSQSDKENEDKAGVGSTMGASVSSTGTPGVVAMSSVEGGTIRSYTGLQQNTQERVRRFEIETKAMLQRENLRKREDNKSNTSLTAIGQSIGSSKEAVDNSGKRLKTCKQGNGQNGGSGGIRKGSLDSLKDSSWTSDWNTTNTSETECGDLVVSLTSTFDAKMKDLSSTKKPVDIVGPVGVLDERSSPVDKERTNSTLETNKNKLTEDFRDPSLHKNCSLTISQCKPSDTKSSKEGIDDEKDAGVLSDKENCNTKLRRSESLNKRVEKNDSCKLRRTESLNKKENKSVDNKLKRSDSLTKDEKTESNLNKRRQLEAGKMYKMKRKVGGIHERSIKRRHTVGGTKDFDKATWLDNRQTEEDEKNRRTSSPDLSRHVLSEVRACSLVEPASTRLSTNRPLESHM